MMPLQNRVDPFGRLHAVPTRGRMMGNRGILHDDRQTVRKPHAHPNWVTCALSFNGRRRQLMAPRRYTELFFLDEATALAAGHRPCAACRRARYRAFTQAWQAVHGGAAQGRTLPQTIDRALHAARITKRGDKLTYRAEGAELPDGTMIADGTEAFLIWNNLCFRWAFTGYTVRGAVPDGPVTVLTPHPVVAVLRHGYRPEPHPDLDPAV